jgi:uncharacterized coiled-coil protein SlyX
MAGMEEILRRVDSGEVTLFEANRIVSIHPLFNISEVDWRLQQAFEQAGAINLAAAIGERRLLIRSVQDRIKELMDECKAAESVDQSPKNEVDSVVETQKSNTVSDVVKLDTAQSADETKAEPIVVPATPDHPAQIDTVSTENERFQTTRQAVKYEDAWLLEPREAERRLWIIETVIEESDHEHLDHISPEWRHLAFAMRQWFKVESDRSYSATPFYRDAVLAEQAAVKRLQARMTILKELFQSVESGTVTAEELVLLWDTDPALAVTEGDRELLMAFGEIGATEIATALGERRLLLDQMQVRLNDMILSRIDDMRSVQCPKTEEAANEDVMLKVAEEQIEILEMPPAEQIDQTPVQILQHAEIEGESISTEDTTGVEETTAKVLSGEDTKQRNKTVKSLLKSLGRYDGNDDFEVFLMQLELIARMGNWSEHDKLCHLVTSLSERAAETLLCLKNHLSYDEAVERLHRRFTVTMHPDQARRELYHLEQRPGEAVEDLASRAERLAAIIAPLRTPADREELLVLPAFLDALEDDDVSFELRKIDALDMMTAVRKARHLQCLKEMRYVRYHQDEGGTSEDVGLTSEVSERTDLTMWPRLRDDDEEVVNDVVGPVVKVGSEREIVVEKSRPGSGKKKGRRRSPDVVIWNSNQRNRRNRLGGLDEMLSRGRRNSDGEQSGSSREGSPVRQSRPSRASRQ